MTDNNIVATVETLTTKQLQRILHANFFTPGRTSSEATNDPHYEAILETADKEWAVWHKERYGRAPSKEVKKFRAISSRVGWGMPMLFLGKPGAAKTSMGERGAKECGLMPNTIVGSQENPEDVGGYPSPNADRSAIEKLPSPWVDRVCRATNGSVQIFDEITTSDQSMEAAMLRVFSDGAAGERRLVGRVRIIAFGNRVGEVAQARDLTAASANRFAHFHWEGPTTDEWRDWVQTKMDRDLIAMIDSKSGEAKEEQEYDPNKEEMRVLKAWPSALARAKGLVSAFVGANKATALHDMPEPNHPQQSKGWPSHRSNEQLIRALAACDVHGLGTAEMLAWVSGLVGADMASELITFKTDIRLPDALDVLDGKVKFEADEHIDRTAALLDQCAAQLVTRPLHSDDLPNRAQWVSRGNAFWRLCRQVYDKGHGDLAMMPGRRILGAGYGTQNCPDMHQVFEEFKQYIHMIAGVAA